MLSQMRVFDTSSALHAELRAFRLHFARISVVFGAAHYDFLSDFTWYAFLLAHKSF